MLDYVALLAEGVDRNSQLDCYNASQITSPSSRRAWIEISYVTQDTKRRNGRPPRGGRG